METSNPRSNASTLLLDAFQTATQQFRHALDKPPFTPPSGVTLLFQGWGVRRSQTHPNYLILPLRFPLPHMIAVLEFDTIWPCILRTTFFHCSKTPSFTVPTQLGRIATRFSTAIADSMGRGGKFKASLGPANPAPRVPNRGLEKSRQPRRRRWWA